MAPDGLFLKRMSLLSISEALEVRDMLIRSEVDGVGGLPKSWLPIASEATYVCVDAYTGCVHAQDAWSGEVMGTLESLRAWLELCVRAHLEGVWDWGAPEPVRAHRLDKFTADERGFL